MERQAVIGRAGVRGAPEEGTFAAFSPLLAAAQLSNFN